MSFYETKSFRRLNAEWREKLKESGFKDLEDAANPDRPIEPFNVRTARWEDREAVQKYFRQADDYLRLATFKTKAERRIWELHCSGLTTYQIARKLNRSEFGVRYHVNKHRNAMFGPGFAPEPPDELDEEEE